MLITIDKDMYVFIDRLISTEFSCQMVILCCMIHKLYVARLVRVSHSMTLS